MKFIFLILVFFFHVNAWSARVLQIGDSHTVGGFGTGFFESMKKNAKVSEIQSIGLAGSKPSHWSSDQEKSRTTKYGCSYRPEKNDKNKKSKPYGQSCTVEKLSALINTEKPDIVVVELGDNFAVYKEPLIESIARTEVQRILKQINTANQKIQECYWVGPNWTDKEKIGLYKKTNSRAQALAELIKKEIDGKCTFIDSMQIVAKSEAITSSDGIHYGPIAGKVWGQRAYQAIAEKSDLLNSPVHKLKPAGIEPHKKSQN